MFISPTELIGMSQSTAPMSASSEKSFIDFHDSPIASPAHAYGAGNQSVKGVFSVDEIDNSTKKVKRPPSMYMEQLLNDDSSDDSSFINYNEKEYHI